MQVHTPRQSGENPLASNLTALIEQLFIPREGTTTGDELRRWFAPFLAAFPPERPDDEEPSWDPEAYAIPDSFRHLATRTVSSPVG